MSIKVEREVAEILQAKGFAESETSPNSVLAERYGCNTYTSNFWLDRAFDVVLIPFYAGILGLYACTEGSVCIVKGVDKLFRFVSRRSIPQDDPRSDIHSKHWME